MKTSFILLIAGALQVHGYSLAQTEKISLRVENEPVQDFLTKLEETSSVKFLYRDETIQNVFVSLDAQGEPVENILRKAFEGTEIVFKPVGDNLIVITSKVYTQQYQVKGTVRDALTNEFLPGVNIIIQGINAGAITNGDGNFTLNLNDQDAVLVFSFIGYISQQVSVKTGAVLDIRLEPDVLALEEVVVIGYGTQAKKNVSGSVSSVSEREFNQGISQTAADLLQGKVAGLTITTEGGDVTANQTIRLRGTSSLTGSSSPFIVIDGVPGMDINSIAPEDIESISVLKDASATAIYGSRSASGVILITTKKGKQGKSALQYSGYVASEFGARKPDVLDADQWRKYALENNLDVTGLDKGADTDWFREMMRTAISHSHNLALSGGLQNGSYRSSINYLNRQGVMKDNHLERFNGLLTANQKALNGSLNLSFTSGIIQSDYRPTNSYNTVLAYNMLPVYPVKNPDGSWFDVQEWDQGNPVRNQEENEIINKSLQVYINTKVDLLLFKGLNLGVNLFKQRKTDDNSLYNASTTQAGRQDQGYARRENSTADKNLIETTIDYSNTFGKHDFKLLAGYSYEDNFYQSSVASNRMFISNIFKYNNLSTGENLFPTDVGSYKSMSRLISFFGRLNYNISGKYIFTATMRRDGSSKFGANHKWGNFPSISMAWRISEEGFLDNLGFVNELKIRVGYGVVGNQDGIDPYQSLALYGRGDEYFENGKWHNSYRYAQNNNPDLKWEQTSSFNPGLDFSLLAGKISGSLDYYIKKTSDLLYVYNVPVPPYLYPTMLANVGDMSNKGFEVVITGEVVKSTNFRWLVTFNLAHNKNKVVSLSNDLFQTESIKTGLVNLRGSGYLTSHIIEEGREVGTFYNLKYEGIDEDGNFIISDLNNDGSIDIGDYTYIGTAMPDFSYGLHNTISYKNIDFTCFFRGLQGNDVLNSPRIQYGNKKWLPGGNVLEESLTNGINQNPLFSSYYIEDGSFLRLDNASLAYNFKLKESSGIEKVKVYLMGQNLFVLTKFKGLDPEVNMNGLSPGIMEPFYVPRPRSISIGVDLNF